MSGFGRYGRAASIGMLGAFLKMGVNILKVDFNNQTIYISVPRDNYEYYTDGEIKSPETLAKGVKRLLIMLNVFDNNCKVKYKIRDEEWTKEMGEENYKKNLNKMLDDLGWSLFV
jgi:hypothetical protein